MTSLIPCERVVDDLIFAESPRGQAVFSMDRAYRYLLRRWLSSRVDRPADDLGRVLAVCMVNPSDADAFEDDPTINELIRRSSPIGADTLEVVNLFALRSSNPSALRAAGPAQYAGHNAINDRFIRAAAARGFMTIAAWGNNGVHYDRAALVRRAGGALHGVELHCLGLTSDGYPKHPLARGKHRIPRNLEPARRSP